MIRKLRKRIKLIGMEGGDSYGNSTKNGGDSPTISLCEIDTKLSQNVIKKVFSFNLILCKIIMIIK